MAAPGRTPLARLYDTARQAGITVVDAVNDDGPLLDDDTAAFVACGVCIALNPGLDDDGLRADVLAMALALTYATSPSTTGHAGDITTAGGFALISRTREAEPVSALGMLAAVIAREHGRDTDSAAFEYTVPVLELPRRAPLAAAGAALRAVGPCALAGLLHPPLIPLGEGHNLLSSAVRAGPPDTAIAPPCPVCHSCSRRSQAMIPPACRMSTSALRRLYDNQRAGLPTAGHSGRFSCESFDLQHGGHILGNRPRSPRCVPQRDRPARSGRPDRR